MSGDADAGLIRRQLDSYDAFQLCKGLYAVALAVGWSIASNGVLPHIIDAVDQLANFHLSWDIIEDIVLAILVAYASLSLTCLFWRNRAFQVLLSIWSMFMWSFAGAATLLAGANTGAGIYEILLAMVSVGVLYHRGRNT